MLDMSVPVVAKFRRLLDSLPRETLPDVVASMIRTSNMEKTPGEVLDALSLEERFKKALPMLTRQIEGLKLLQKTRKKSPDNEKTVLSVRKDCLDIRAARTLLDNDHYAMDKLKRRVLEYLAVRQLKTLLKGPILCFVGPQEEFHRIALGGVCDQSDIRGHRRTYVGSMPGRIINGLKTVAGDLGQVLDPEQNHSFTDHYPQRGLRPVASALYCHSKHHSHHPPRPLDRMEVLQVPGGANTQEEKVEIAHTVT
ncbi:hypothetical protein KUCAC02_020877 [Chaenocephalus aceratus]|uniref:Uncharacterized protein n=1 Tax=Chaenocephalus aceratus TaxID=36190 RepID=A0ACB9XF59_CHAAC|nr:hypothetical protein KUCAC02_020877 [Chaenocephalus aceratus]